MYANNIKKILKQGKEIEDLSQIGKMRDIYAINFFTFENLQRLIQAKNYKEALIFMPFVCCACASFDSILDIAARINLLLIAFEVIKRMHNIVKGVPQDQWNGTALTNHGKQKPEALTVSTEPVFRRMISTLFVLISELHDWYHIKIIKDWEDTNSLKYIQMSRMRDLGIERFGTHPLENFNGFIRDQSCCKDTCQTMHSVCAKSQMMKKISIDLELGIKKRNRANAGGLKVSEFANLMKFPELNPVVIVESFFILIGLYSPLVIFEKTFDENELNQFFEWIVKANADSQLDFVQKIRINSPSNAANSRIQARNVSYN